MITPYCFLALPARAQNQTGRAVGRGVGERDGVVGFLVGDDVGGVGRAVGRCVGERDGIVGRAVGDDVGLVGRRTSASGKVSSVSRSAKTWVSWGGEWDASWASGRASAESGVGWGAASATWWAAWAGDAEWDAPSATGKVQSTCTCASALHPQRHARSEWPQSGTPRMQSTRGA